MDLLDGDLHQLIQGTPNLSDSQITKILYQLIDAVDFMHKNGVLHRDLKPANLLLTYNLELKVILL